VDIKLIALAIDLYEEDSPVVFKPSEVQKVLGGQGQGSGENKLPLGFHNPTVNLRKENEHFKNHSYAMGYEFSDADKKLFKKIDEVPEEFVYLTRWWDHVKKLVGDEDEEVSEVQVSEEVNDVQEVEEEAEEDLSEEASSEDSDSEGWITPSNYKPRIQTQPAATIGVLSTDFAVQNTLLHTNIPLISQYGQRINSIRSYILRCYACFATTANFEKFFCPRCGNKTLKKISVSVENGSMKMHFSKRFVITPRGKKYSLPTPKGGKCGVNPVLTEDQHVTIMKRSKKAVAKEIGPFAMNDVNTRAFMVGGGMGGTKYWERANPNAARRK